MNAQEDGLPQWLKDDAVTRIAAHDALAAALEALSALTTACATNAYVMREIDLSVYDAAVEAEGIARDELHAARHMRLTKSDHPPGMGQATAIGVDRRTTKLGFI